jgi:cyclic beta-1,2-glucan synthetase
MPKTSIKKSGTFQNVLSQNGNNTSISGELYSVERLEQFAAILASEQREVDRPRRFRKLLPRLKENGRVLVAAYKSLIGKIKNESSISPAAEWLVDNFYVVEEQLREIQEDLPVGFYRELPKLKDGDFAGLPRIYAVAVMIIAHTDSRLEVETLERFLNAYQKVTPLTIGELWAFTITLRFALVENLRRSASRIVVSREEREEADKIADELIESAVRQPAELLPIFKKRFERLKEFGSAFIEQLIRRLRDQDQSIAAVYEWLETQLHEQGTGIEQIVQAEYQNQTAAQITVGNIITSMRLLSTVDWNAFFESVSLIETLLETDPAKVYAEMNFFTRNRYREAVERIAKRTKTDELIVAERVIRLAEKAQQANPSDKRHAHIGYYLIDQGLAETEKSFDYHPPFSEYLRRSILKFPTLSYLGSITFLTTLLITLLVLTAVYFGTSWPLVLAFALLSIIPASDLALSIANWEFTVLIPPRILPQMETSKSIPETAKTMVVIPTLLTDQAVVGELLEKLEIYSLANRDENIFFALLGDFADADAEEMPDDSTILESAENRIVELNDKYPQKFYLFHRRRRWNESESKWMGWERKRGKLEEFNGLLRGDGKTSFSVVTAETEFLRQIKYVITLDSDTQLPRDAARKLIGIAEHPLNRPFYDEKLRRVTGGYGILQPRISISLTSAARSHFARILSGNKGIDPYTTASSDIYQDLFGEGSFTGKGLYDVDAFALSLKDRVGENTVLSHDLLEGLYARCGLVSDIELLDDFPTHFDSFVQRSHRWVRGDWQIAGWLFRTVKNAAGEKTRNDLSLISRWKILDNLRRSLAAPTIFLWLLAVWTIIPGPPLLYTLFILFEVGFPIYAHLQMNWLAQKRGLAWTSHFWSVWGDFRTNTAQVFISIVALANQAYSKTDAIIRTLYRQNISRRNLLEWQTAAKTESENPHDQKSFFRLMRAAIVLAIISLALIIGLRPEALPVAVPFILAWLFSPIVMFRLSRPPKVRRFHLSEDDTKMARMLARRTWRFFETFVGDDDNWLPPDNFQEDPQEKIAHRTSPTNIGLLLLSTVSAYDFGYIGTLELTERLGFTFSTLEKLEKNRGHFFNWYDTETLAPLAPRYISTVDSGNLAGHLLAVKQSVLEIAARKLFDTKVIEGLADSLEMMREEAMRLNVARRNTEAVSIKHLNQEIEAGLRLLAERPDETPDSWLILLNSLAHRTEIIKDITDALAQEHGAVYFNELQFWANDLSHQANTFRRDIKTFIPWQESDFSHLAEIISQDFPEIQQEWREIMDLLNFFPSLAELAGLYDGLLMRLLTITEKIKSSQMIERDTTAALNALQILAGMVRQSSTLAIITTANLNDFAWQCAEIVEEMNFSFLIDPQRKVFAIGFNVENEKLDNSFYDLLASEARLTGFVAIAKGEIPQDHWFKLGRALTPVDSSRALISWTATMFEYLMPILVMRDYDGTLLNQTYRSIVARQIEYAAENNVPWGISESAYNARDLQLNYQYQAFGVPGLGLKRGLSDDLVISPYSTALAAIVSPGAAMGNFRRLVKEGALARFGFYEAIDYTPERLPPNRTFTLIRAFMAHHQGMILVALNNLVHSNIMQKRFHTEPLVQATELLLQERIPQGVPALRPRAEEVLSSSVSRQLSGRVTRIFDSPHLATPRTQILSNGSYSVMITNSGAGYSMYQGLAVTRWREDTTRDRWGSFIYLRDTENGKVWSAGYQPLEKMPRFYEVAFSEDNAVIKRRDGNIATSTEIIVSPEDDAEIRRVSVTNNSSRVREIEITSYAEIVLVPPLADAAHPAFSNLFIETEFNSAKNSLIAKRRPRAEKDEPVWAVHTIATEGETVGSIQYETDRARFLGRGHEARDPLAIIENRPLSNTVGAVLDPIFSIRRCLRIQPHETVRISFSTFVAHSSEEALRLADKYHDLSIFEREAAMAWTHAQVEMRHLNIEPENAYLFQRLAAHILYSDNSLRARPQVLALNTKAQSDLWVYGIGGDLPIVLIRINRSEGLPQVRQLLNAHEYLRLKGLMFDLVILNDNSHSYIQALQDEIMRLIRVSGETHLLDKTGGIFLKRSDQIPEADRILLHTVARVVMVAERGDFEEQILRKQVEAELPKNFVARAAARSYPKSPVNAPNLAFFNGLGGFSQDGKEYVTILGDGQWTPAPWLNVIANEKSFGFQVSETGSGFTWSVNSRENRLTPWSNDAVGDASGEVIYLRDEETGATWTPTPLPIRESEIYTVKHGQGYSLFEHESHGIDQELLLFVPLDASVKISRLTLKNQTNRRRKLSVTNYNELVLGFSRSRTVPFIVTEINPEKNIIWARNPFNNEFAGRIAFVATNAKTTSLTCDRKEFLGRNGSVRNPAALKREKLSGRNGAGLDPCAALQAVIELEPNETREIVFLIGETETKMEAENVIARFQSLSNVENAFAEVLNYWDELLGTIKVRTPDAALNTLVNRWLLYQSLACRVWSRSAFYQSGGAFGFRDQLQDVMSLVYSNPKIAREQILLSGAHQFKEGDVQHWWHPPTGRGVRTRFSDDLLWLPFVTSFYVKTTGDRTILDEIVPFIEAPLLIEGQDDSYTQPAISTETASIFEHCARAIDRSLAVGAHGLPLIGSGDWNDGMSSIGNGGKGESVWLGWFLINTLTDFTPFCGERSEKLRETKYQRHIEDLKNALEKNAWDGNWFRRAYFDDGTPLGSAENEECRIDSIAQSWSVISGGASLHQATRAMASVDEYLIRRGDGIVLLFTPPFNKSSLKPGYIKGYIPGVRENGGQYTHAAIWTLMAFAMLGDGDKAGELFALLNPINHASTRAGLHKYKVEPYVTSGDVYGEQSHLGRGGWTWYTGSAGWMYRSALESMLGFILKAETLKIEPCIPRNWQEFEIDFRYGKTLYQIRVENPSGVCRGLVEIRLDGNLLLSNEIPLVNDGQNHQIKIILGEKEN